MIDDSKIEEALSEVVRLYQRDGIKDFLDRKPSFGEQTSKVSERVYVVPFSFCRPCHRVTVCFDKKKIAWEHWYTDYRGNPYNATEGTLPWKNIRNPNFLRWLREELEVLYLAESLLEERLRRIECAKQRAAHILDG